MVKKTKITKKKSSEEVDSVYFLKLVLFMILGSLWIKIDRGGVFQIPIPIGFIIGLFFVTHEHFRIDRKIEYAVLLVSMFVGFWLPLGLFISL